MHRLCDGVCEGAVLGGAIVKLAVRFDVVQAGASCLRERGERPDLVQHAVVALVGGEVHVASPETLEVGVAWMRADCHARVGGDLHRAAHHVGVAGVHAAGDVDARDEGNHLRVEAERVAAEALAQIGIQINAVHGNLP